ncbi:hypothetical protein Ahy_A07g037169 [Arachis hypogaea]|uniref:Myb/SANT-like domain-containing protein n=1 Tax=Arachis hypogaea TaxID=3818 RepID=A0A445CHY7_ARAHY|nr:hypothetical protein Ahy_A07g037169 [Arachis hypogaea]
MPHEDAKLIECLIELETISWRYDNGTFKSGYRKYLIKCFLKISLDVNPHIKSRMKLLKRQYFAVVEIVDTARSGFSWNDKDKMYHPNANGLYNKLFSHFEELGIAFGREIGLMRQCRKYNSSSCYYGS